MAASHVASGILLSRVAGLVRERVFAHYFGNSDAAGAFRAALRIPNFLQNLFGEGVLSASFIPVYARLLGHDEQTAGRVAGAVASLLALAVSVLVALGVVFTPAFVALVAPGFSGQTRALTVQLVRVLFPGVGLLVLSAWCLGVLNSHRSFFLSYVAPVFWNAAMIGTLVMFGGKLAQADLAVALAWGTVAGSALQFGVQLPAVLRHERSLRLAVDLTLTPVREVLDNFGPAVITRGAVQLSAYLDAFIASFLGPAAVAGIAYAQTIYLLPIGLFGMSVAAAELPGMSREAGDAGEGAHARLRERLAGAERRVAFFIVPSTAALLFLGGELVAGLFQTGRFGPDDTLFVRRVLAGSTPGLLAAAWSRLYASAFYALKDTRSPLRFAVARVTLSAALGWLFAFPLGQGAAGLTFGSALGGWVEYVLLRRALAQKAGRLELDWGRLARLTLCSAAGVVAAKAAALVLPWALGVLPGPHAVITAAWAAGVFGLVYLAAAKTLDLY